MNYDKEDLAHVIQERVNEVGEENYILGQSDMLLAVIDYIDSLPFRDEVASYEHVIVNSVTGERILTIQQDRFLCYLRARQKNEKS